MSFCKTRSFLLLLVINSCRLVSGDEVDAAGSDEADKRNQVPAASLAEAARVFSPGLDPPSSLSLLSSSPEDQEVSEYCRELLRVFGRQYVAYVNCLIPAARPVRLCQTCFSGYVSLVNIYKNISEEMGPGNVSCSASILRSDRLMLINLLYTNLEDVWETSGCDHCLTNELQDLTNDTLYYLATLNQTLTCFEKYQQGNHTELCKNCKSTYKHLSKLYSGLEKNGSLCVDIEDAMNMTRKLWSKTFNCSFPRVDTVPVIAVSSFMLFLPIIFYLSSFLHSEQKKRKLIHPKRAKSYTSLMNIQDKLN